MGQQGSTLEERYFVQKVKLGTGSFGTVWRAVDNENGRTVAIKQIDKAKMQRRGATREDTAREISVLRACHHENITALYHTYEDSTSIYLALEYCDGGDFEDKLRQRAASLPEQEAINWMHQILSAISTLHARDVCHRDIKPSNFMVAGTQLKLSDFGLAIYLPRGKLLTTKCGTPAFMAPEQHALPGSKGYGCVVDVWAAGVVACMLIYRGRHPFLSENGNDLDLPRLMRGEIRQASSFLSFSFMSTDSNTFSEEAHGFCRQLVNPRASSRPLAVDAARHVWLTSADTPLEGAGRSPARSANNGVAAAMVYKNHGSGYGADGQPLAPPSDARDVADAQDHVGNMMQAWAAAGKAAREAAAEVMTAAPARFSRALEEVKDAMHTPIVRTQSVDHSALEAELLSMGATKADLLEVKELLDMNADLHDVRQAMRRRLSDRHTGGVKDRDEIRDELLSMGFQRAVVEDASKRFSTSAEAVDWILGSEATQK